MTRAELEEERDFLLASLRDLEAEKAAGDIEPGDYQELVDTYTARAAEVIRALEADPDPPGPEPAPTGAAGANAAALPPGKPRLRALALALALALGAGAAGWAVAAAAGRRAATDEATGSLPDSGADRIAKAQALVNEGRILDAVKVYDSLLDDDPANPVALAERGWVLSRVDPSLVEAGLADIDRALLSEPDYPEAHFFRGMILWRSKSDPAGAAREFQLAIDARPPPSLLAALERARDQARSEAGPAEGPPPPPAGP